MYNTHVAGRSCGGVIYGKVVLMRIRGWIIEFEMTSDVLVLEKIVQTYLDASGCEPAIEDLEEEIDKSWCVEEIYWAIDAAYSEIAGK